jgi:hypothetical protein
LRVFGPAVPGARSCVSSCLIRDNVPVRVSLDQPAFILWEITNTQKNVSPFLSHLFRGLTLLLHVVHKCKFHNVQYYESDFLHNPMVCWSLTSSLPFYTSSNRGLWVMKQNNTYRERKRTYQTSMYCETSGFTSSPFLLIFVCLFSCKHKGLEVKPPGFTASIFGYSAVTDC